MSTRLRELAITSLRVNEDWIACRASQQSASQTTFDLRSLRRHDEASRLALAHHSADWKQIGCRRLMLLAQTPLRTRSVLQKGKWSCGGVLTSGARGLLESPRSGGSHSTRSAPRATSINAPEI